MSGILETNLGAGGGGAVEQLSSQFGLSGNQTQAAIKSLLPALTQGLQKNIAKPHGAEGLLAALQGGAHQRYLEQPSLVTQAASIADGNKILGHVFGSKDASRAAAAQASGVDAGILKKMLPMLATLAMGAMSKKTSGLDLSSLTGGSGGGMLGAAMGALGGGGGKSSGGLASMLGGPIGGGGGKDDDGFGLDDVMGLAGKLFLSGHRRYSADSLPDGATEPGGDCSAASPRSSRCAGVALAA